MMSERVIVLTKSCVVSKLDEIVRSYLEQGREITHDEIVERVLTRELCGEKMEVER